MDLTRGLGGDADFGENSLSRNDDGSSGQIDLSEVFPNGLNFFGEVFTSLYINNNGSVTFNGPLSTYTPTSISSGTTPGIFPFWADVDTRGGAASPTPGGNSQGTNLVYYDLDPESRRFTVTWDDVGYYSSRTDLLNAFQLVLEDVSDEAGHSAGDFSITFRYESINWTTGNASGGTNGLGGSVAHAGYSAGNASGTFFELPSSGIQAAILTLDEGQALVFISTAAGVNQVPIAGDDSAAVDEDGTVDIDALANDSDADGDTLSLLGASDANGGTVEIVGNQVRFTPASDFNGPTNVTYQLGDSAGNVVSGTILVDVAPQPDAPVAGNDTGQGFSTDEATPFTTGNVLANDSDADGDTVSVAGVDLTGTLGTVTDNGDGTFDYDPNGAFDDLAEGETATDSFKYTVSDGTGRTAVGTVTVTVSGVGITGDLTLTLPDSLAPGETGNAVVDVSHADDRPALIAVSAERGLVADPFGRSFTDTVFVLAQGGTAGATESIDVAIKGSAGPNSTLGATAQLADPDAVSDIGARFAALQPSYTEAAVVARIETNLEALFGTTIGSLTDVLAAHADRLGTFDLSTTSATAALAFAIEAAGDYGSLAERGKMGSLGQGWASLADLGLAIDGTSVELRGLTDIGALRALSLDASALYTVSNSTGRSVSLSGDVLALAAPARPSFEQGLDGQFQTIGAFTGTLVKSADGYAIELRNGDRLLFDADGAFLRMAIADGREIVASHDAEMRITGLDGPNGAALTFIRDADGKIQSAEDADGRTTTFAYDANGMLATVTRAAGQSSFEYDANGDLTKTTAPGNITSELTYDALGRLDQASYGGGAQTEGFAYDDAGGLTITDGAGRSIAVDLLPGSTAGRVTDSLGGDSEIVFDDEGNIAGVRAPDGTETGFELDDQGRLIKITDANGAELGFSYGATGTRPESFTDAGGNARHFTYDAGGRITEATWADGTVLAFDYDGEGNLTGSTNRRGDDVTYTYDARGRLLSESDSSAGPTTYTYDARGRLISATSDQGTTTLAYDDADRVTRIDTPTGRSLLYTYDAAGLRTSISDGGDYNLFYAYDALGRLTSLSDETSQLVTYQYDAAGNLVREENGNGTVTIYDYDEAGRLTLIENRAPDGTATSRFAYTYDVAGQRVGMATLDGTWTYGYDAIGQLTSAGFTSTNAAIADKSITYEYDAAGNRTRVVEDGIETLYESNALNQYTRVGTATFAYDAGGNTLSRSDAAGTTTYAYDLGNRLISVTEADGTVLAFTYDVFGNRVARTLDGVETEYLVDPFGLGDVVSEFSGGTRTASYAHGLGLAAGEIGGTAAWYDADAVGSVAALTNASGTVVNTYAYTPFGTEIHEVEGIANDFEFNGVLGVAEDSDDLTFMRARSYSDELGRFLSEDPLWSSGDTANLSRFAASNPVSYLDPFGLQTSDYSALERVGDFAEGLTKYAVGYGSLVAGNILSPPLPLSLLFPRPLPVKAVGQVLIERGDYLARTGVYDMVGAITGNRIEPPSYLEAGRIPRKLKLAGELLNKASGLLNDLSGDPTEKYGPDNDGDGIPDNLPPGASYIPPVDPLTPFPEEEDTTIGPAPGEGTYHGEPHLTTFDGLGYDFQAVGEFVLARGDNFEIQTRYAAIRPGASVGTAVAMRIGADIVGVYAHADDSVSLLINGTAVVLEDGQSIPVGGGSAYFDGDNYVVTNEQGEGFTAHILHGREIGAILNEVRPFLGDGRENAVEGLLGDFDGETTNDLQLADGTVLGTSLPSTLLYGDFADAWRITQEQSLFIYGDGESTETFTNRNFPEQAVTLATLDPAVVAAARAIVLGTGLVEGTFDFDAAVFDVAITGDPAFATDAAALPPSAEPSLVVEINVAPTAGDDNAAVDEDGTVDVDVLANDSDPEDDALSLLSASDAHGGTATIVGGQVRFTPAPDFDGQTNVTYQLGDSAGNVVSGTILAEVAAEPDDPVATDDAGAGFVTDEATPFTTANVLANDTDADGDSLGVAGVDVTGTLGLVTDNGDGTFHYDPNGAFDGLAAGETATDSFKYTVSDGTGRTDVGTVVIAISGVGSGFNIVTGVDASENLPGTEGPDDFDAGAGDDVVSPLGGADRVTLGAGADVLSGTPSELFRDQVRDFSQDDRILFQGAELSRDNVTVSGDPTIISVDTDNDGSPDGSLTLVGDFSAGDFMTVAYQGDTSLTFEAFLPSLLELQAVAPELVNGIINQEFLRGDGVRQFEVTLSESAVAGYDNSLGVYEIDATGAIDDARILVTDANAAKGDSVVIGDVEAGHWLGFFIVQDGADFASQLAATDTLMFQNSGSEAAHVGDGADNRLAVNGTVVDETIFHSFDPDMNADGIDHAVSGVEAGGHSIYIGFEDLTGGGDRDYQDLVLRVSHVDPDLLVA